MSEEETAEPANDDPPFHQYCAHCGSFIGDGARRPITKETTGAETATLYSFCDAECQTAWAAEE